MSSIKSAKACAFSVICYYQIFKVLKKCLPLLRDLEVEDWHLHKEDSRVYLGLEWPDSLSSESSS
jgi:hypothetical protein